MPDMSDTPLWLMLAGTLFFAALVAWGLRRQRGQPPDTAVTSADINEKAALTAALNQALDQVEQARLLKVDFLSRMSHDIRTPLNVVLGLLELEKNRSENLTIAWQNAGLLRDLIDNLLDLSRIETGELQLKPAPHPLWQTLHKSEEFFANRAAIKALRWHALLDVPRDDLFYFDKSRLNQVIASLLGNAIKYTSEGEVTFYATLKDAELHLRITCTGNSITPDAMYSTNKSGFQSAPTLPKNSGLELTICSQLAELMGGKVTLINVPDEGTEANVVLPVQPATVPNSTVTAPAPLPRRRIMIVDDFPANLTMLTLQLEKLGQEVIACESARAALAALNNTPVDMLITDCQMPDIDGYQLATLILIQEIAGTTPAPTTLLSYTANAQQKENDRARHAGMDGLLHKQLTTGELRQALLQYANPPGDTCDLTGLYQLANGQPEVIALMRKQMRNVIEQDLQQLGSTAASAEKLSKLAHRLKASWNLFSMHETTRRCQAMEALPELLRAGLIEPTQLSSLAERFTVLMNDSLIRLDAALEELSDKY